MDVASNLDIASILPSSTNIQIPSGANNLFPNNIGPKIFAIPDKNQILKAGHSVKMSEAEAMRFVARNTHVPVPQVERSYVEDGVGYIFMTKLEGEPLGAVWKSLTTGQKAAIVAQLKAIMEELSQLDGDFYGALWHRPCQDVFFTHLPFRPGNVSYGPFFSRQEYNQGLVQALANSRPDTAPDTTEGLVTRLVGIDDNTKVFTHGDLQLMNILVDKSTAQVTGIVDWEGAGFSIRGREYYEAKVRARDVDWADALDEIFPYQEHIHFDLLEELERAVTIYTFI